MAGPGIILSGENTPGSKIYHDVFIGHGVIIYVTLHLLLYGIHKVEEDPA